ncbi:MAG: (d)CMP kinase [Caldilineaceae bacterium]
MYRNDFSDDEVSAGVAAIHAIQPAIIAIDGPAAAGKSTIGYALAELIGYLYFDTGIMYRAVTYAVLQRGIDIHDTTDIGALANAIEIEITPMPPAQAQERFVNVSIDGVDVTGHLRTGEVDRTVSVLSAYPAVREALSTQQRRIAQRYGSGQAERPGIVMVGRDIGTVVLPEAKLKIYMDATLAERTRRRYCELRTKGKQVRITQVMDDLKLRDKLDSERAHSPLRPAGDAVMIDTSDLSTEEVIHTILTITYDRSKAQGE